MSHPVQMFKILNMCSDLTRRARILQSAIALVARSGRPALTARAVAAEAGVSPASVIHHYESMAGLLRACDVTVTGHIRAEKVRATSEGMDLDLMVSLTGLSDLPLAGYLATSLGSDSQAVADLVDELVTDALANLTEGERIGVIRPSIDARARAVVLTLTSLGALVMHRHLNRLLNIDLLASPPEPEELAKYVRPVWETYQHGLFTDTRNADTRNADTLEYQ